MSTPYPRLDRPAASRLWFGLLGGPLAWAVAFISAYLMTESACVTGGSLVGPAVVWLLGTAVAVAATVVAWGARVEAVSVTPNGDAGASGPEARSDRPTGRRFMAIAGVLLSGVFAFITLTHAVPLFVGVGC